MGNAIRVTALLTGMFVSLSLAAEPTITYQGQLQDESGPVTDTVAMQFRLYDSETDGTKVSENIEKPEVSVSDGLFQVALDFDAELFEDGQRYLEVEINGETLSPRQPVSAVPLAMHAIGTLDSTGSDIRHAPPSDNEVHEIGEDGTYPAMTMGADSLPVISFFNTTDETLMLAACTRTDCSEAEIYTVDDEGEVGADNDIAIGTDGNPVIAYSDATSDVLRVAACTDPQCSDAEISTLDGSLNTDRTGIGIAIGAEGRPIISYEANDALMFARCDDAQCNDAETVEIAAGASRSSIAVAANFVAMEEGQPVPMISFANTNGDPAFAICHDAYCDEVEIEEFGEETPLDVQRPTSITVGTDGNPVMVYSGRNPPRDHSNIVKCLSATCDSFEVRSLGSLRGAPDVLIDHAGNPVFSIDSGVAFVGLCSNAACESGRIQPVSDFFANWTSLAIRGDGRPLIAASNIEDDTLNVIDCANEMCLPYMRR